MHRRLSRALIALAVPAILTTPALVPSATAAPAGPGVPTVTQVASVYPHLAGGTSTESTSKVHGPGRRCRTGKPIKGASARSASYQAPIDATDPTSFQMTGAKPGVFVTAMRFPSARSAIAYLHRSTSSAKKCPATTHGGVGSQVRAKTTRIRFRLGDERWGYQTQVSYGGQTVVSDNLFVRAGNIIVLTGAMSTDGTAPSVPKAVQLTKVALKAARH